MSINEIGRVVIAVPGSTGGMGLGDHYVGVALDQADGVLKASSVAEFPTYAYSLIGSACDGRAVKTVGGDLVVQGKQITPEKYLGLWREALKNACTPQEAAKTLGVNVSLVVRGNLPRQLGQRSGLCTDPMKSFDGWAAKYAAQIQRDADGYFEFELDLLEPDSFVAWDHMWRYADHNDRDPRSKREMRVAVVAPAAGALQEQQGASTMDGATSQQHGLFA